MSMINVPTSSFGFKQGSAKVISLALSYIPPMPEQVRRPMAVTATPDMLEKFVDEVVGSKTRRFHNIPYIAGKPFEDYGPKDLTHTCNGLVGFSPTVETNATIPYGWRSDRYSFDMVISYSTFTSKSMETIRITGFTDRFYEASFGGLSGHKPPEMTFHSDHITVIPNRNGINPIHESVITTSILPGNTSSSAAYRLSIPKVLEGMDTHSAVSQFQFDGETQLFDMDSLVSSPTPGVCDNLITLSPVMYATEILNGISQETRNKQNELPYHAFRAASQEAGGDALSRNVLMSRLADVSNTNTKGVFTLSGLCKLDPEAAKMVMEATNDIPHELMFAHNEWGGGSLEESAAWQLLQTIISCAYRNGIGAAEFHASNYGTGSLNNNELGFSVILGFNNGQSIAQLTESQIASFEAQVKTEALPVASAFGTMVYQLKCQFDVTRISQVEISIEGDPPKSYMFPMFTSSCSSPFLTTNGHAYNNLVGGLCDIGEAIFNKHSAIDAFVKPNYFTSNGRLGDARPIVQEPNFSNAGKFLKEYANSPRGPIPPTGSAYDDHWVRRDYINQQEFENGESGSVGPTGVNSNGHTPPPGSMLIVNSFGTNLNSNNNAYSEDGGF